MGSFVTLSNEISAVWLKKYIQIANPILQLFRKKPYQKQYIFIAINKLNGGIIDDTPIFYINIYILFSIFLFLFLYLIKN